MNLTQGLHRAVQQTPDRPATVFGDRTRTWAESGDRVARLAAALRGLGIGDGDRVGTGSRFIQYEVTLVARVNGSAPTLQSIAFGNNAATVPAPKETR